MGDKFHDHEPKERVHILTRWLLTTVEAQNALDLEWDERQAMFLLQKALIAAIRINLMNWPDAKPDPTTADDIPF